MISKNAIVFKTSGVMPDESDVAAALAANKYEKCRPHDETRHGWISPYGEQSEDISPKLMGCQAFCLKVETKKVPASAIAEIVEEKIQSMLASEPGLRVSKKMRDELKQEAKMKLLPNVPPCFEKILGYHDSASGFTVVLTSSIKKAEGFVRGLSTALENKVRFCRVVTTRNPSAAMTNWLTSGQHPAKLSIEESATLRDASKGTIKYVKQDVGEDDRLKDYLSNGMMVVGLAVCFHSRVRFTLDEALTIKSIKFIEQPKDEEEEETEVDGSPAGRFNADFILATGELRSLIEYLIVDCFGGDCSPNEGD